MLRLSGEIRNRIYEYAFGGSVILPGDYIPPGGNVTVNSSHTGRRGQCPENWAQLQNLTRVCRRIRAESRLLPRSHNNVWISPAFGTWVGALNEEVVQAIQRAETYTVPDLEKDCPLQERLSAISSLLPNVKKLFINTDKTNNSIGYTPIRAFTQAEVDDILEFARVHGWQVVFQPLNDH